MDGRSHPSLGTPEKDDGCTMSPLEACVLREGTERPHGTPSSGASTNAALDVREHTPLASDAWKIPLKVANPIDSSSRIGRGRNHWKNLRWHRPQKELCQTVRSLGIPPSAKLCGTLLHYDQPYHSSGHHDEVMLDWLEEGQLLEDDSYLSDSILKELDGFGMEGLGWSLGAKLGAWEGLRKQWKGG